FLERDEDRQQRHHPRRGQRPAAAARGGDPAGGLQGGQMVVGDAGGGQLQLVVQLGDRVLPVQQTAQDRQAQRMPQRRDGLGVLGPVGGQQVLGGPAPLVLEMPGAHVHGAGEHHRSRRRGPALQGGQRPEGIRLVGGGGGVNGRCARRAAD